MSDDLTTNCRTPEFIVSFPHVFKARPGVKPTDTPKFMLSMLFTPDQDLTEFKTCAWNAAINFFGEAKAKELLGVEKLALPFKRGEKVRPKDELYAGKIVAEAKTVDPPGVAQLVGSEVVDIVSPIDFYGGCIAVATVNCKGYDYNGNKGVTVYLNNVCKVGDGTRLGGRKPATDEFADFAANQRPTQPGQGSMPDMDALMS